MHLSSGQRCSWLHPSCFFSLASQMEQEQLQVPVQEAEAELQVLGSLPAQMLESLPELKPVLVEVQRAQAKCSLMARPEESGQGEQLCSE